MQLFEGHHYIQYNPNINRQLKGGTGSMCQQGNLQINIVTSQVIYFPLYAVSTMLPGIGLYEFSSKVIKLRNSHFKHAALEYCCWEMVKLGNTGACSLVNHLPGRKQLS